MSYNQSTYFGGNGAVKFGVYDKTTGKLKDGYRFIGQCHKFSSNTSIQELDILDAVEGKRLVAKNIKHSPTLEFSVDIKNLDKENFALAYYAAAGTTTASAITDFEVGDVTAGLFYQFGAIGATATTVKAGVTTLVAGTDYTVHGDGTVSFVAAHTDVTVTGTNGASDYLDLMAETGVEVAIIIDGINTMNGDQPFVLQIHRASLSPLESMDFINVSMEAGTLTLSGKALTPPAGVPVSASGPVAGYGLLSFKK